MLPALDISTSALVAQRIRMNAISSNLANMSTTHNEEGQPVPYQPRFVVFQTDESVGAHGASGVKVSSVEIDDVEPRYKYEPNHPDAIRQGPHKGYVAYPNVSMMTEFTDALEAARAYEANLGAIEIAKNMTQQTLRILG
ncbi:MAG: flagellar basal body rod protein FlgC [Planctomycetes bacterium RBG_16_64_12]|nr:MAG: flagellar basal body rod protein FlgC [Planctomycetes bacterium RBG_16_64_12]